MSALTYISCARDQHSPFPPALWCALCGENVCSDESPFVEDGAAISCRRTAEHDGMHRGAGIQWSRLSRVQGAGIVLT